MVKQFLEYSLAHGRKIKVIHMDAGRICARNIIVKQINQADVVCQVSGKKNPLVIPVNDILSACYARGDDGDTLTNLQKEETHEQ
jgi:hypothetical protein